MLDLHPSIYWLIFGLFAICLEVLAPGISMLGIGLGAIITGALSYFLPTMGLEWQLLAFSALAIVLTWACKKYITNSSKKSDRPLLNEPQKDLMGQEFVTDHPLEKGSTRMQIRGSYWTVKGPNLPINTKVAIVKITGSHTVWVEPIE